MKKIWCAAFLLMVLAQPVLAAEDWTSTFAEDQSKYGLDVAVENALAHDVKPEDILAYVMKNREKFSVKMSMKSLYCASVNRDVVQETASKLGVAPEEISLALQESIEECSSKMALQDRDADEDKPTKDGIIETHREEGRRPSPSR